MMVLDASACVLGILNDGDSRRRLSDEVVAVPHLADAEVAHSLRSQVRRGTIGAEQAGKGLQAWVQLGVRRFGVVGLLPRVWALRENLSAFDATYVALAEALECDLVTADGRLGLAPGPVCPIEVVRS